MRFQAMVLFIVIWLWIQNELGLNSSAFLRYDDNLYRCHKIKSFNSSDVKSVNNKFESRNRSAEFIKLRHLFCNKKLHKFIRCSKEEHVQIISLLYFITQFYV